MGGKKGTRRSPHAAPAQLERQIWSIWLIWQMPGSNARSNSMLAYMLALILDFAEQRSRFTHQILQQLDRLPGVLGVRR